MFKRIFFYIVSILFTCLMTALLGIIFFLYYLNQSLPDHSTLINYNPPVLSRIFSSEGRLIGEHAQEKRLFVPYDHIPKKVIYTFLAAEDQNFFHHQGIDISSIIRAIVTNFLNKGKRPEGASTITQQVARNFFLTNEISLIRKIKEALLAFRIEHTLSKERIMEIYLNQIFLGNRSYGVAAAALSYFNKSLEDLTIPEVSFLAGLPKAPSTYHPKRNPKQALQRRNWVLERLWKTGLITQEEFKTYLKVPIELTKRNETEIVKADYFQETVRRELIDVLGEKEFYSGGLFIKTSLNAGLQNICDDIFSNALLDLDKKHGWRGPIRNIPMVSDTSKSVEYWMNYLQQIDDVGFMPEEWSLALIKNLSTKDAEIITTEGIGIIELDSMKWAGKRLNKGTAGSSITLPSQALNIGDLIFVSKSQNNIYALQQVPKISGGMVVMDPHTGRVLALTGGFSFKQSQFNRATQALRQSGSAIKPFVYLAAFENNIKPTDIYVDEPISIYMGNGLGFWSPKNFQNEFKGPMTVRRALETSNNIITIKLAQKIGIRNVLNTIKKMNLLETYPKQLALVLGSGETTVYKITTAYAMLANGGKRISPTVIDWVQNRHGKMIYKHDQRNNKNLYDVPWDGHTIPDIQDSREQIINPRFAYLLTSILQGAVENSPLKTAHIPGKILAGKSGTSNDSKDVWYVGYSANLVVGIYLGYDAPQSLGKMATGSLLAGPIFKKFMEKALKNEPAIPFNVPAGVKLQRVNKYTGQPTHPNDPFAIWEVNWQNTEVLDKDDREENQQPDSLFNNEEPKATDPGIF